MLLAYGIIAPSSAQTPAAVSADTKATAANAAAADGEPQPAAEPKSSTDSELQVQTEREAAAWGFVMAHHPQLGEVLSRLKTMHPGQYEKAITQVTQAAEKIIKLQKADKKRGELELEDWKLTSQIQLAAAKLSLAREDAESQQELAKIVRKQLEHRLKMSEYERDRTQTRLKTLDEQIVKQKAALANSAELRVNEMLREINRTRKNIQNDNSKKAAKSKAGE